MRLTSKPFFILIISCLATFMLAASAASAQKYRHSHFIGAGNLSAPTAMDVAGNEVYVFDDDVDAFKVFAKDGTVQSVIDNKTGALQNQGDLPLSVPRDIAYDGSGNLYFFNGYTLYRYRPSTDELWKYDTNIDLGITYATSGDMDATSSTLYVGIGPAYERGNLLEIDPSQGLRSQWGSTLSDPTLLNNLESVAVNSSGKVYIHDDTDNRVRVFNSNGGLLRTVNYGYLGGVSYDIDADGSGFIYIVDGEYDKVYKINQSGKLVATIGGSGTAAGKLKDPADVSVDGDGKVYVMEKENKRIQVFEPLKQNGKSSKNCNKFKKKIRKLKRKLRKLRRLKQRSKIKRTKRQIKKLKRKLRKCKRGR